MARSVSKRPTKSRNLQKNKKSVDYVEIKLDESVVKLVGILVIGIIAVVALFVYAKVHTPANGGIQIKEQNEAQAQKAPSFIGDAPVLGDKDAKVTIFEYSDYECPFCRRHDMQTFPQIKSEYIDTGKVKYVAKNFIAVPSHSPIAEPTAYAAYCVYKTAGNEAFWRFKEDVVKAFEQGTDGISADSDKRAQDQKKLYEGLRNVAKKAGVNLDEYDKCMSNKTEAEKYVKADQDYVMSKIAPVFPNGVGTPMFVICKTPKNDKAECTGEVIMGAYPFENFKQAIDALLNE